MKLVFKQRRGTSLVELLVVIVIFLVGILAVVQVFPRGLQLIATTGSTSRMNALARAEIDRLRGVAETLPEMILPVQYSLNAGQVVITEDQTRNPDDLGPYSERIDSQGNLLDAGGNVLAYWPYLSGANNVRRVVGEGGIVPAPRRVGTQLGGLMVLQFAPTVYNPSFQNLMVVYGNDLVRREGQPGGRARPFHFFVDNAGEVDATVYVLRSATAPVRYRLSFTAWVDNGTSVVRQNIVDVTTATIAAGSGWEPILLSSLVGGGTFVGAEYDSIRCARVFRELALADGFSADPYEYKVLDPVLGLLLFNRAGYNFQVLRPNGRREPLVARVNYDVYDWRILRDDFRVANAYPAEVRLRLQNLMHLNKSGADGRPFSGMNVFVSDGNGGTENRDFLILDLETGGVVAKSSQQVNYSGGVVTLLDEDNNPVNGIQIGIILPGQTSPTTVNAVGRAMRALYMATGEWALQVSKAASHYRSDFDIPNFGRYYAGGSREHFVGSALRAGESPTRIYFPAMDAGKKVTVGQIWYDVAGSAEPRLMSNQDFLISNSPIDTAVGLPYLDIRTIDPDAIRINYARYGVGVRDVKGSSMNVRVLWNPASFRLTTDEAANLRAFEEWGRNFRRINSESYILREVQP